MIIFIFLTFSVIFKEDMVICDFIWVLGLQKATFFHTFLILSKKQCMHFCRKVYFVLFCFNFGCWGPFYLFLLLVWLHVPKLTVSSCLSG